MASRTITGLTRSLTLIPAALMFHIGAAAAGDADLGQRQTQERTQSSAQPAGPSGDAQLSARRLLLGITAPTVASGPGTHRSARAAATAGDAQESARRVVLGERSRDVHGPRAVVSGSRTGRGHGDAQMLAQQVLLGRASRG